MEYLASFTKTASVGIKYEFIMGIKPAKCFGGEKEAKPSNIRKIVEKWDTCEFSITAFVGIFTLLQGRPHGGWGKLPPPRNRQNCYRKMALFSRAA